MIGVEAVAIEPPQFLQCLVLDLADAFAADLQLFADLGQRVLVPCPRPKRSWRTNFSAVSGYPAPR